MIPSTNGTEVVERRADGSFAPGWRGGPGNPFAGKVQGFRKLLYEAATDERVKAIFDVLLTKAEQGEEWAVKEALSRLLGRVPQPIVGSDEDGAPMGLVIEVRRREHADLPTNPA